ncbi:MAG TPA: AEC family transporter [Burkholderiales bacterium]|nr:AEC family transporter [Burkholderiales bacterium]
MLILERIVSVIAPVFLIIAIGYAYGRRNRPDLKAFNHVSLHVLGPLLVFTSLGGEDFQLKGNIAFIAAGVIVVLVSGLIAWPIARLARVSPRTFVPPMMFNNCGNMGLPLAVLAFGRPGLAAMVLMLVASTLLQFTLGSRIVSKHADWKALATSPMIIASALGLLFSVLSWKVPAALMPGLKMLGDATLPMMLFALGARLIDLSSRGWQLGVLGAVVCPIAGFAGAYLAQLVLRLPADQFAQLMLFASLPPAALNYLLAERYSQEPERVASLVLIGNAFAIVFVPVGLTLGLHPL